MPQSMQHSGWNGINFDSPFADLAILLGINWLKIYYILKLYHHSVLACHLSPLQVEFYEQWRKMDIPNLFGEVNEKYHIPRVAIIFNAIISMIIICSCSRLGYIAAVISTATLVAYLTGPTTVIALRKMGPTR